MTKIATAITGSLDGYDGTARLYYLDPALEGRSFVIVNSKHTEALTDIYMADSKTGIPMSWEPLASAKHRDGERLLIDLGYEIQEGIGDGASEDSKG